MTYFLYTAGEQQVNKQFLQMQRHIFDIDVTGCCLKTAAVWNEAGYCQIFWPIEGIPQLHEEGKKLINPSFGKKALEQQKEAEQKYWQTRDTLLKAVSSGNQKEIARLYDTYRLALRRVHAHFITSTGPVTFSVEEQLKKLLNPLPNKEEAFITLTESPAPDLLNDELLAWKKTLKNPTEKSFLEHGKKYSILLANMLSESSILLWAQHRAKEHSLIEVDRELRKSELRKEDLKKRQTEILTELRSEEVTYLSWFLQETGRMRLLLKACWNAESINILPFYEYFATKTNRSLYDIYMFYTSEEISTFLHTSSDIPKDLLEKRKNHCLIYYAKGVIKIYNGEDALEAKKKIIDPSLPDKNVTSFKGMIANQGVVEGIVRILKHDDPAEINKISKIMGDNEILVAGMTNPTMIPLVRKAKGIVTDEGGITCHAANISREFGLPCIVGCKQATIILRDGDFVEVDATKGIIKIIKRKK